jgi:hypothetical protein
MKERKHKTLFQQIILYECNYSCGSFKIPNFPNDSAPWEMQFLRSCAIFPASLVKKFTNQRTENDNKNSNIIFKALKRKTKLKY